jgi:hypothetical protein
VNIKPTEMTALALWMAAQWLEDDRAFQWEDVPNLDEDQHAWLLDEINDVRVEILNRMSNWCHQFDVDIVDVITEATS